MRLDALAALLAALPLVAACATDWPGAGPDRTAVPLAGPIPAAADPEAAPAVVDIARLTAPLPDDSGPAPATVRPWAGDTEALWAATVAGRREQGLALRWDAAAGAWRGRRYEGTATHVEIRGPADGDFHTHVHPADAPAGGDGADEPGMFSDGDILGFLANRLAFKLLRDRDGYHLLLRTAATRPGDCGLVLATMLREGAASPSPTPLPPAATLLDAALQCASDHGVTYYRGDRRLVRRMLPSGRLRPPPVLVGPDPGRGPEIALSWPERAAVQAALKYDLDAPSPAASRLELDGGFGPGTRAAIRAYQQVTGDRPTGFLDEAQYLRLVGSGAYGNGMFVTLGAAIGGPGAVVLPVGLFEGNFPGADASQPVTLRGRGRAVSRDGLVREGEFAGGSLVRGTLSWPNGAVMRGRWVDDNPDGEVRITYPDGAVFAGTYDRGRLLRGVVRAEGHRFQAVDDGADGPRAGRRLD